MHNDPNANFVIATYRPFAGKEEEAAAVVKSHFAVLREAGLVTDQQPLLLQSADGTFLEIFEWAGPDASRQAHEHPAVQQVWGKMNDLVEYTTLSALPEANKPFAPFRKA